MTYPLHKLTALMLGICISTQTLALDSQLSLKADVLAFSEIAPLEQLVENLRGPPIESGTLAFTSNRIELGQRFFLNDRHSAIDFAVFSRLDYRLKFTPDTAQLLYLKNNRLPVPGGDMYQVAVEANHVRGSGISLGYRAELFEGLEYSVSLAYLAANEMLYGDLSGQISALDKTAQGDFELDYFYSKDILFDRPEPEEDIRGRGYTLDASLLWRPMPQVELHALARDLASGIRWKGQQRTVADATSDRVSTGSSGGSNVRPLLVWRETNDDVTQELPRQFTLRQSYLVTDADQLFLEQFIYGGRVFKRAGYGRALPLSSRVQAYYDFDAEAFGIELSSPYLSLGIFTDTTDFEQAKTLGANLTISVPLAF